MSKFYTAYTLHLQQLYSKNKDDPKTSPKVTLNNHFTLAFNYLNSHSLARTQEEFSDLLITLEQEQYLDFFLAKKFQIGLRNNYEGSFLTKLKVFFSYTKLLKIGFGIKNRDISAPLDRHRVKRPSMTIFYGARFQGKTEQIIEAYRDKFLNQGILMTTRTQRQIRFFASIINAILSPWVTKTFKEARQFFNLVQGLVKEKKFTYFNLNTPGFSFRYRPRKLARRPRPRGKPRVE